MTNTHSQTQTYICAYQYLYTSTNTHIPQPPVGSTIYATLSTPTISSKSVAFETLYIGIWPMPSGQDGRHYWEATYMCFFILFQKYFHILLIFWRIFCYPGHIFYDWVENDVHLQWRYSMGIFVQSLPVVILYLDSLTLWGQVTHICVGNLTIIGPDNGFSPGRSQAIFWTNAGILLIGPWGTNFSEVLIGIHAFSFKKIHLKMSSAKWRSFYLGLNVLIRCK